MTELITKALVEAEESNKEIDGQTIANLGIGQPRKTAIFGNQEAQEMIKEVSRGTM